MCINKIQYYTNSQTQTTNECEQMNKSYQFSHFENQIQRNSFRLKFKLNDLNLGSNPNHRSGAYRLYLFYKKKKYKFKSVCQ